MFAVIRTSVCVVLACVLLADTGIAQRGRRNRGEVTFKAEEIKVSRADMAILETRFHLAENGLRDYVRDSLRTIEAGHRTGFQHFAIWFRERENAKNHATDKIMIAILKELLGHGLTLMFPEATPFIKALKTVATKGFDLATKTLQPTAGDVNLMLERLRLAEEEYVKSLLDTQAELRRQYAIEWEAAKWEWVDSWYENPARDPKSTEMPEGVLALLDGMGVPRPSAQSATRVAEDVLTSHIHTILANDEMFRRGAGPFSYWTFARLDALSKMDAKGNLARICEIEQRDLSDFFRRPACRR